MPQIVLATLNAKYIHASFGLRYLLANLNELASQADIREYDINQRPLDIVESLLSLSPTIIGLGVYIWNSKETLEVIRAIKAIRPETIVVIGGPEVSHEISGQPIAEASDFVITGEADISFREFCVKALSGELPTQKIIHSPLPDLAHLALPYAHYTDSDIKNRIIYVEASRGCPFTCEFCLSSLDIPVRQFDVDAFLSEMQLLLDRGVQQFKFVDRTFNLNLRISTRILNFFLERYRPGLFVHFEMVPDRLPDALRTLIQKFPPGALQFEVGIQTFNPEVAALISRRQDYEKLSDNLRFLRQHTTVHVHADLIAGLPGETFQSFAIGFDRLVELGPQEIQVGILKRLRGTPIQRHSTEYEMQYSASPPYEVLQTKHMSFLDLQRMRRFAKLWDQIGNSGNFTVTTPLLWQTPHVEKSGPFNALMQFSDWLHTHKTGSSGIALKRLTTYLFDYLVSVLGYQKTKALEALSADYFRLGRTDKPAFLSEYEISSGIHRERVAASKLQTGERQARHLGAV